MAKKNVVSAVMTSLQNEGLRGTAEKIWRKASGAPPRVPEKLSMVVIEVTTYCNLKCSGCVRTIMTKDDEWSNQHMSVADYRKVVDAMPPAKLFIPQGIGESTMHPEIVDLIRIAKESKKFDRIEINTNGLVRPAEFYGKLFEAGLSDLTVSVDTLDETLIEKLRAETDIPKLEERLGEFSRHFPGKIGVRVTVSKGNVNRLDDLFGRISSLGRFSVWLQPFFDMGFGEGVLSHAEAETLNERLPRWTKDYPNLKITLEPFIPSTDICPSPWTSPAVTVDGQVKPCCLIMHQEQISFGNVLKVPFKEIWSSDEVEKFRKSFVKKSPDCCARCPYYTFRSP